MLLGAMNTSSVSGCGMLVMGRGHISRTLSRNLLQQSWQLCANPLETVGYDQWQIESQLGRRTGQASMRVGSAFHCTVEGTLDSTSQLFINRGERQVPGVFHKFD